MKKLVLVAALFMFVCGGSFVANAQDPVKTQQQQPATGNAEEPKTAEPAKEEPKQKNQRQRNRKLNNPQPTLPPTVLLQRKHLHSLLNNSKHTATKAVPSLSILGNAFVVSSQYLLVSSPICKSKHKLPTNSDFPPFPFCIPLQTNR